MKASEAQVISKKNEISLEEMYKQIKSSAEHGNRATTFFNHVSNERMAQLISDGYKISSFSDPIGMNGTKVEW